MCECSDVELNNGICEDACNSWKCGFDGGVCSTCATGCNVADVGDGACDLSCLVEACNFDSGDCATIHSPNVVYVQPGSGGGTGTSQSPYLGLETAVRSLWQPVNHLYLLAGEYLLLGPQVLLAGTGLRYTEIRTLFCAAFPSSRTVLTAEQCSASPPVSPPSKSLTQSCSLIWTYTGPDCPLCTFCPYMVLREG